MTAFIKSNLALLLKETQFALNERLVQGETRRDKVKSEIQVAEYEIAKLTKAIEELRDTLKCYMDVEGLTYKKNSNSEQYNKSDQLCLIEILRKECEKEVIEKEQKLRVRGERKQGIQNTRDAKKIQEQVTTAKKESKGLCLSCGKISNQMFRCGDCFNACYCDNKCQERHWLIHQFFCVKGT